METLKYKVISSRRQYDSYCKMLEGLVFTSPKTKSMKEEIALLTLLIEKYDQEHNGFELIDPIQLLHSLLKDHQMNATELSLLLETSKGYVSDILHYKKGLSKSMIRKLASHFKLSHEAFNRHYPLERSNNSVGKRQLVGKGV